MSAYSAKDQSSVVAFSIMHTFLLLGAIALIYVAAILFGAAPAKFDALNVVLIIVPVALLFFRQYFNPEYSSETQLQLLMVAETACTSAFICSVGYGTPSAFVFALYLFHLLLHYSKQHWFAAFLYLTLTYTVGTGILGKFHYQLKESSELNMLGIVVLILFVCYHLSRVLKKMETLTMHISKQQHQYARQLDISAKISRFIPSQIAAQLMAGQSIQMDNRRRRLTVFFSDIVGFTALSERLSSEELSFLLNSYMDEMTAIAKRFGGTVDKFVGDAMMVFFGDPETSGVENDALRCVDMAIAMRRRIEVLKEEWSRKGWEGLDVRMGVNTGYAHVGNYGHKSRLVYTVIGSEVNMSARLQTEAEPGEILISKATFQLIKFHIQCHAKPPVRLKGFDAPVEVWRVEDRVENLQDLNRSWLGYKSDHLYMQLDVANMNIKDKRDVINVLRNGIRLIESSQVETIDKTETGFMLKK